MTTTTPTPRRQRPQGLPAAKSTDLQLTIAESMTVTEMAASMVTSGLFTDLLDRGTNKNTPEAQQVAQRRAMVKILAGREMGMEPIQAMMGLEIVEGRLGIKPEAAVARIQQHPDYRLKTTEHSYQTCTVELYEKVETDSSGAWEWDLMGTESFSIWDAATAGLCTIAGEGNDARAVCRSSGGKPMPWEQYTRNMLYWRTIGNLFRFYVPHLKLPNVYTTEELEALQADSPHLTAGTGSMTTDLDDAMADFEVVEEGTGAAEGSDGDEGEDAGDDDGDDDGPAGGDEAPESDADPTAGSATSATQQDPSAETPAPTQESTAQQPDQTQAPKSSASPAENTTDKEPPASDPTPAETPGDSAPSTTGTPPASSGTTGESPTYQEWLKWAKQARNTLGDDRYYELLAPFCPGGAPKANAVPPGEVSKAMAALQAALEHQGEANGTPAPSAAALKEANSMRKPELLGAVGAYEERLGFEHREAYGIGDDPAQNKVDELRTYVARLTDLEAERQQQADDSQSALQV